MKANSKSRTVLLQFPSVSHLAEHGNGTTLVSNPTPGNRPSVGERQENWTARSRRQFSTSRTSYGNEPTINAEGLDEVDGFSVFCCCVHPNLFIRSLCSARHRWQGMRVLFQTFTLAVRLSKHGAKQWSYDPSGPSDRDTKSLFLLLGSG